MVRRLSILTLILFFYHTSIAFSQIAIDQVAPGPYTPGSSIAATFSIGTECMDKTTNKFELYLSDATGNFVSNTPIGSYTGFYAAFVNGVIPTVGVPAGTGYRLRIRSTNPVFTSDSGPFTISVGPPVNAAISSSASNILNTSPLTFGKCYSAPNFAYNFTNASNADNVSATITNQLNPGAPIVLSYTTQNQSQTFNADAAHYTIFVRAQMPNGTIGTSAYFLVNNRVITAFATTGTETVCYPTGVFEYAVTVDGPNSIKANFPGNIYKIDWGDGSSDNYTYCDIIKLNKKVSHTYTKSSCGVSNGSIYNAFRVTVQAVSPFNCGDIGSPLFANARVVGRPINAFNFSPVVCITDVARFTNQSTKGQQPNLSANGCTENRVTYTWSVDGIPVPSATDVDLSFPFEYTFKTKGSHTIRLTSNSEGECQADPVEHVVCVQDPPKPKFTLPNNAICLIPGNLSPTNTSEIDPTCVGAAPIYTWTVTPITGTGTLTSSSPNPQFHFTQAGVYNIHLAIRSGTCTVVTPEQKIVVNGPPTAVLSQDATLCGIGNYTFGPNSTTTKTIITGSPEDPAPTGTYKWELTGGATFAPGSDANSQYPTINFSEYKEYTVKVTHTNGCDSVSDEQKIAFLQAPALSITSPASICYLDNAVLKAEITGRTYNSLTWSSTNGGTFSAPNNINTTFTPSATERKVKEAVVILTVSTGIPGACATVSTQVTIRIDPDNTGVDATKTICTGTSVNFIPTSAITGSTFSWTATNADGNAAPGSYSATGTKQIDDQITNTNPTANAVVVYTITPAANGCTGTPFTLTVTVTPKPVLTATAATSTICSGGQVGINLSSNLAAPTVTYYTWTRTPATGITGSPDQITPVAVPSINEILTSTGTTSTSVTYTITPQLLNGCPGEPKQVVINVLPPVTGNTVTGVAAICTGSMPAQLVGSTPTGGDGSYFYQWQSSPDGTTWADITGANAQNYQPGILTETTHYRRGVSSAACRGTIQNSSAAVEVVVNPNAKAEYTYGNTLHSCAPFALPITAVLYPDRNDTYTWIINADGNITQSAGPVFPGYTIQNPNERVIVKLVVTSRLGCAISEFSQEFSTIQKIVPSFTPVATVNCGPTTVSFVNTSIQNGDASFKWDFGNGQTANSATPPAITFSPSPSGKDTTYVITLYAITPCGTDSVKGSVLVKSEPRPVFSPSETSVCSPALITFTNNSPLQSGIQYSFDFGDGSPILVTNDRSSVTHIYRTATTTQHFQATMTAVNSCGTKTTDPYIIEVKPNNVNAELVVNGNQKRGCAPFKVTFDNNSTGADEFSVDFNDGTQPRQSIQSPERFDYTFTRAGIYKVMLVATSHNCARDTTYEEIEVLAQPMPTFEADITQGCTGLQVQFKNTTQETNITGFIWDFGDGTPTFTGVEPPVHTYTGDQEYYTVTLTASNVLGCSNTEVKTEYIHVIPPPVALFNVDPSIQISIPNYIFKFIDQSLNNPDQWIWDFGDGSASLERNPSHTYLDTGTYKVTLKVINQNGCFTTSIKNVRIDGVPGYLFVPNSFIPGSESNELRTFSAKGSGIKSWKMSIFNKWGQLLWETTKLDEGHPQEGWDGTYRDTELPQSVYYWKIDVEFINGSQWKGMTYDNSTPKRTGSIHLIR